MFQPSQYGQSKLPPTFNLHHHQQQQHHQQLQQQQRQQYLSNNQDQPSKYVTRIHYYSNIGSNDSVPSLNRSIYPKETFQQSAGEDTCSSRNNESLPASVISPMNHFLGSLHQQ